MKDSSNVRRSTSKRAVTRARNRADRLGKTQRSVSVSRWRALEHEQFRALVASPREPDQSNEGLSASRTKRRSTLDQL